MIYWYGVGLPIIPDLIDECHVMDSIINYYPNIPNQPPYQARAIFMDSGGYTVIHNPQTEYDVDRIIDIQEAMKPEYVTPLDHPPNPGAPPAVLQKVAAKNMANLQYWHETSNLNVVPVLHGVGWDMYTKNFRELQRLGFDYISMGRVYLTDRPPINAGAGRGRHISMNLIEAMEATIHLAGETGQQVHLLGSGAGVFAYHLARWMGFHSLDSAGYMRRGVYAYIILPGGGNVYCGDKTRSLPIHKALKPHNVEALLNCDCNVCKAAGPDLQSRWETLQSSYMARVNHNLGVMKYEERVADELEDDPEAYAEYIWSVVRGHTNRQHWAHVLARTGSIQARLK